MNIFDPSISGSLSVSGSGQISGDLNVLGTLYATVSGTTQNSVSASHAASYTLTSSFHQFTSSYTTGSFTGSFIGNGAALYNIPASGVTGLNLSQISDGTVTASLSQANGLLINTNTEITGNLTVTGRLTAQEYHTELVSASIIYESGSSKFGDSLDDVHQITGSVDVSGSLEVNNIVLGTDRLVTISVSDAGGKYFIDNVRNPTLTLIKGYTYKFLYPNIGSHPFRFSTTNDGTHNGGVAYTTGVTIGSSPDYIQIEVTDTTPSTLYYFCTSHTGMGNSISVLGDILNNEADRNVVYIEPSRIATTGSNIFVGTETISGSLSVTGSVDITGSITLNGQAIGTGKLDETVFNSYTSSNDSRVSSLENSTSSLNTFTNSIDTTIKNKMNTDGVVSGSIQISITGVTGYSTFSSSIATTDLNQENRLSAIETSTGSLNTFTSSANGRLDSLESASGSIRTDFNSYTSSNNSTNTTQNSRLDSLESASSSIRNDFNSYTSSNDSTNTTQNSRLNSLESTTSSLNSFSSSALSSLSSLETASGSIRNDFNSYTSSNDSTNSTQNSRLTSLESSTSSLNSFTSSIDSTIKTKLNTEGVISGSVQVNITSATGYSTFSSSIATTDLNQENRLNSLEGKTGSYATTGSNIFQGSQTITGSLYISQDLIVAGSSSIQNISSSQLDIGTNIIKVNALNPSIRFGGLSVIDSGSAPKVSGSLLFDSINDQWIFVHQAVAGAAITSSVLLMGPQSYDSLGSELYPTTNRIVKSVNAEHLGDSNITDTGTIVSINSNTEVTGTLVVTQNISSPNISAIQTATGSLNSFTSSVLTAIELTGSNLTVKGNLLVKGTTTNVNVTTLDVDNNLINLNGTGATSAGLRVKDTTSPNQVSGSLLWDATNDYWIAGQLGSEQRIVRETEFSNAVTRIGNVETSTGSLNSFTSSINTTIKSKLNSDGVISGSSQVNHNATTNYDANQHVDHTSVSITAGSGLSGGGTIASTRTITLDTGSVHFLDGVKKELNTEGVVSGSSQISFTGISNRPALVSGSAQISFNGITDKPTLVSGSSQISFNTISDKPTLVSGSSQIVYSGISSIPSGIVSGSSQITYSGLSGVPSGIVSGSVQVTLSDTNGYSTFDATLVKLSGDQTITGQKTFPSAIGNRPILSGGFISAATGDLNVDLWGISEDYYPSHGTAANAWGIRWSGDTNDIQFVGGGSNRFIFDLDNGNLTAGGTLNGLTVSSGTISSGTWNGTAIGDAYISSATNWNTAYNKRPSSLGFTSSTVTLTLGDATTITASVPTFNQNTTGTASNITAYTINQSVGTSNSPTFTGLALGDGVYTYNDTNRDAGAAAYYPNAWTRGFRFSFANASSTSTAGNYSGVLHFHPWDGTTASTGDASYQLAFGSTAANGGGTPQLRLRKGIDTTWNSWYTVPLKATASFSSVSSVTVTHNFNTKDVMVMVYDNNDEMFWPSTIVTTSVNVVTITFTTNRTGRVVIIG